MKKNDDNNGGVIRQVNLTLPNGASITLVSSCKDEDINVLTNIAKQLLQTVTAPINSQLPLEVE